MQNKKQSDKLGEECGIFAGRVVNINTPSVKMAQHIKSGLLKLQHRGQESAGICIGGAHQILYKNNGFVEQVLDDKTISSLKGSFGIGHVRYSTQGETSVANAQPHLIEVFGCQVSIAHNGNIKNAEKIKNELKKAGETFNSTSDSEVMLKKIAYDLNKSPDSWSFEEVGKCLDENFARGAFSIVLYMPNRILAFRDPCGYRPLMFCEAREGFFIASEDVAFSDFDTIKVEEIKAGWGVEIKENSYEIKQYSKLINEQKCVFETIYFANPASNIFGLNVYKSRVELGKLLAKRDVESGFDADIVVPVMDSGFASAIGYSKESKIPFEMGLSRNDYQGRSFIQPTQQARAEVVRKKLTPVKSVIQGKKIVLVDDSVVRGTTSKEIIKMLKDNGAKEVHFRLASPMIKESCFWGVDIPTKEELLANVCKTEEGIAKHINADSVRYLSFKDLKGFFGEKGWCYKCFSEANIVKNSDKIEGNSIKKCEQYTKIRTKVPALV